MSAPTNTLLVDVGNTRIKYALADSHGNFASVFYCHEVNELGPSLAQAHRVLVASVANGRIVEQLTTLAAEQGISCRQIVTQSQAFGISCAYDKVDNLGVDRWLAVLGARKLTALPTAILDLGTANTCDIVTGNQHLGGWIAPGYTLMRDSLVSNTENVFADSAIQSHFTIGNTTESCVNFGCMATQFGLVHMAERYLQQKFTDYCLFVTGGMGKDVEKNIGIQLQYVENLVLIGLSRFI